MSVGYEYIKVLLYAYPKLKELAEAIAAGAEIKALLSFRSAADTQKLAETIAEEIARSEQLLELKEKMDAVLRVCGEEELFLLEYKYFRRTKELNCRFSGKGFSCSERTYFRRQNALLKKLALLFRVRVMSEEDFLREYRNFPVFLRVYRVLLKGEERKVVGKRRTRRLYAEQCSSQNSAASGTGFLLPLRTKMAIAAADSPIASKTAACAPVGEETASSGFYAAGGSSGGER